MKHYYWRRPSVFKLVELLGVNNVKELCALGKFIRDSFRLYKDRHTSYSH